MRWPSLSHVTHPHEDELVMTVEINGYHVKRVIIDSGTSMDVLFLDTFKNMGKNEKDLQRVNFLLMWFASITTYLVGVITLPVFFGEVWKSLTLSVTFIVVDALTLYNAILGQSNWNLNRIIQSTYHQLLKFLTPHGIGTMGGDQPVANIYYFELVQHRAHKKETLSIQTDEGPRE